MGYLKANKLKSRADVVQRGIFRFLWCTLPAIAFGLLLATDDRRALSPVLVLVAIAIPVVGMVLDSSRLNHDESYHNTLHRKMLICGFIASIIGLPVGLLLRMPVVWGLAIAGIVLGGIKLRMRRSQEDSAS